MSVRFELPQDLEHELRARGVDPDREARELYLVELYREDWITHHQLAQALGLDRLETEAVLKRHQVSSGVTAEEMQAQAAALRAGLGEASQ
jgi:predicted HTH domain antitoxin